MGRRYANKRVKGAVLVEFAFILPILILLLLSIMEFGMLVMQQLTLMQAAREGSRLASVGGTVEAITQRIQTSTTSLANQHDLVITLSYSTVEGATFPYTLSDLSGGVNNAPTGSLLQAQVACPYHLITGRFFSWLPGVQGDILPLSASVVMRRE